MKKYFFTKLPTIFSEDYDILRKENNYNKLVILGIFIFAVQIFAFVQNLYEPFTDNTAIIYRYYSFYEVMIVLNIVVFALMVYVKKKKSIKSKFFTPILVLYTSVLHFWAMGVAIADSFQGQDIVVYYLSMFFLAILINISVIEFGLLLIVANLIFVFLISMYGDYIISSKDFVYTTFQFILFSLTIRYYLGELTLKNFIQTKRLEEINNKLKYLSYYDSLSNLYNRRKWEENFHEMYIKSIHEGKALVVILVDIDYFKQYNDYYGHVKGDEVIRIVSKALSDTFKDCDCNIGRYGGDEFIISIEDYSESQMYKRISELKKNIRSLNIENVESKINSKLSISIGSHISIPIDLEDEWGFVAIADRNLYLQKENR